MTKQSETGFKERVQEKLKTLKDVWFVKTQQISIRGTPDILLCCNSVLVALELKSSMDARLERLQAYNLAKIYNAGGIGLVVCPENWDEIFNALESFARGAGSVHNSHCLALRTISNLQFLEMG